MTPKKVNEIMSKILKVWIERHGFKNLDQEKIKAVRNTLLLSPNEDGLMRVTLIGETETHLVPFEDIVLNGMKGEDVKNYPIET